MIPHFLDLEIHPDGISIFRKETHTAQYTNFSSYTKWNHKIAWIRSLLYRAKRICSPNKHPAEFQQIKKFASYNGFSRRIFNGIVKKFNINFEAELNPVSNVEEGASLWLFIPFVGIKSEYIAKSLKRKLFKCFKDGVNVKFNIIFSTNKLHFYTPTKDRIPLLSNSSVIYQFVCPGCNASYVGETENTLFNRTCEHGWKQTDSAIHKHIITCSGVEHIKGLNNMNNDIFDLKSFQVETVRRNTSIVCRSKSKYKSILLFKEALVIKERKPLLNHGLKHSKNLNLF